MALKEVNAITRGAHRRLTAPPPTWVCNVFSARFKEEAKPLVVIELDEADACDAQAQALKFSEAVTAAIGVSLVAPGLPVPAGLRILAAFAEIYGRPTYLLFGAEHSPQLIDLLRGSDAKRIVLVSKKPLDLPKAAVLNEADLRLSVEEGCALAGSMLSRKESHCVA